MPIDHAEKMSGMGNVRLRLFIAAQIGVPLFVLGWRIFAPPVPFYGWGWEMFS